MANIPSIVAELELSRLLKKTLTLFSVGKVRETYLLPEYDDLLLIVATDRLSIFDFVLPCLVPEKGEILTALTIFWLNSVFSNIPHHLKAFGLDIDQFLPSDLRQNPELQRRSMIVQKLEIIDVECVVRGYLTGSGWRAYERGELVCGHKLREGLHDGSKLAHPIFTPTTKSEKGHDIPLSPKDVREKYGEWPERMSMSYYLQGANFAGKRNLILADTKFEFGPEILADEALTPDSSRFWDLDEWKRAVLQKKSPSGYDKEPVRQWGKKVNTPFKGITGINTLDTEDREHLRFVHSLTIPEEVIESTCQRYHDIFGRLTKLSLSLFQERKIKISS